VTEHYEFALPNKLFEYLMAGLPVLAAPRREIARRAGGNGCRRPRRSGADGHRARAVRADPADLTRMRFAAIEAAKRLNWQSEQKVLTDAVARLAG
jgi:hypothetical protein